MRGGIRTASFQVILDRDPRHVANLCPLFRTDGQPPYNSGRWRIEPSLGVWPQGVDLPLVSTCNHVENERSSLAYVPSCFRDILKALSRCFVKSVRLSTTER